MYCVAFQPDTPNILVSGSGDKTIKMWDITSGSCLSTLRVDGEVSSLDISPCGTKIAATCNNYDGDEYEIKMFDLNPRSRDWEIQSESTLRVDGEVSSLDISPCGTKIAATCNNYDGDEYEIKMFDLNPRSRDWEIQSESTLRGHRYVPSLSREYFLSCFCTDWCV